MFKDATGTTTLLDDLFYAPALRISAARMLRGSLVIAADVIGRWDRKREAAHAQGILGTGSAARLSPPHPIRPHRI
jgi:hypothetical protein